MSAEFRRFLASLAIDPQAYAQFLADPTGVARAAGLSEEQQELLAAGDQHRLYVALSSRPVDDEDRE